MALKRRQAEASKDAAVSPCLPIYALLHLYYLRPFTISYTSTVFIVSAHG